MTQIESLSGGSRTQRRRRGGMLGLKKRRRVQIVVIAALALALSTALIGYAMRDGINYFRTPTEVLAHPPSPAETFRIGGLVQIGSLQRHEGTDVTFKVTDKNASIPVSFQGVLPDLFGEDKGVVALGHMQGGRFVATQVLARHDENYMPKEVVDALKAQGVYVKPEH